MPSQRGSVLLFVLFACMIVAVVTQSLSVVVICADRARVDEDNGRARLSEKNSVLAALRKSLIAEWRPIDSVWSPSSSNAEAAIQGTAELPVGGDGWLMKVAARQDPAISRIVVSAIAERGRDGIDLPLAAVVAKNLTADLEREEPWVDVDSAAGSVGVGQAMQHGNVHCVAGEQTEEPLLGPGCQLELAEATWRLDPGWMCLGATEGGLADNSDSVRSGGTGNEDSPGYEDVQVSEHVLWISGNSGNSRKKMDALLDDYGIAAESPVLIVVSGGADLDVGDRGDLYGVLVADSKSVRLEGTVLHGAVFTNGEIQLGATGRILYLPQVLRWATDQSLRRVRLVPGTRWETIQ